MPFPTWQMRLRYFKGLFYTVICDVLRDLTWALWFSKRRPRQRDEIVRCLDGGTMMLHHFDETDSLFHHSNFVVLLVHGLSGNGTDAYALELVRSLRADGIRVVSSTRRGCGDLPYTSKQISHAAAEADVAILSMLLLRRWEPQTVLPSCC